MKHLKIMSVTFLVFLLLLTGCSIRAEQNEETEETDWEEIFPFEDFAETETNTAQANETISLSHSDSIFNAKFEGDKVAGKGEIVDGVYRFNASRTDGEAWHVKLECNYPTVAGRDYFVTYKFNSNVAGKVKFGDFQEFRIQKGENSITGIMIATGGLSYLDLQLGMLSPFTIDFTQIEVKEFEDEMSYEDALPAPINFERESRVYERHDSGYTPVLIRRENVVNLNYLSAPMDSGVWKSRLYVRTGLIPEPGVRYRVSADIACDEDMPFELLFNNGEEEKGYGALYGQKVEANKTKKIEAVITGNGNVDELVLQASLGEAPDGGKVIFGNVKVEKIKDGYTSVLPADFRLDNSLWTGRYINRLIPTAFRELPVNISYDAFETVYEQHDAGYVVELKEIATNAFLKIKEAPAKAEDRGVWKVRLYAATGVSLVKGKTYRLKYDLVSNVDQAEYEACFDGNKENAYGVLYGRSLKAGKTDHVEQWIVPESNGGPLTLRLQLGKTDSADGNKFLLSGFTLEEVGQEFTQIPLTDFSYDTSDANVREQHDPGYVQSVTASGNSATLNIEEAPESDRGVWKSKLLINTGVTPEADTKYVVSFDINGSKNQDKFEACFDGDQDNKYGALYDQKLTAGETKTIKHYFKPESSEGELILRLQLGETNDASGNKITISNLKVAKITLSDDTQSILPDDFAYPVVSKIQPDEQGFVPVPLSSINYSEGHDPWFDQSVEGSSLQIRQSFNIWESKLFVDTGTRLEAGNRYKVTANLSSDEAMDFEICYNNGGAEKGYGALFGQHIEAGKATDYVCEFDVASDAAADKLILQFMTGKSPVPNKFTLNSVKIEKYIPGHKETITVPGAYKDVDVSLLASDDCDGDYEQSLSGMSLTISAVSADPGVWKSKLFVDTGVSLEAGKKYKVSSSVTSTEAIPTFEILYNKDGAEKGFDADYSLSMGAETKTVEKELDAKESGKLSLQYQLGLCPVGTTFTVNGVTLKEWVPEHEEETDVDASYEEVTVGGLNAWEEHDEKFKFAHSVEGTALKISQDRGVWESKLFANTGTKPEAGKEYKVTASLTSDKAMDFEVCYNNGDVEKAFDAEYGQHVEAGETKEVVHTFTAPADLDPKDLILQFMTGKSPLPNTITVNSITLEKKQDSEEPSETVDQKSFDLWAHEDYEAALRGDGSSASVNFTKAPEAKEVWKTKLFAKTGAVLEAGKTYRISADVKASSAASFEICYNRNDTEKGFDALYGQTASETSKTITRDVTVNEGGTLNIQFSIGNYTAGDTFTVSNIKVEEYKEAEGENLMKDPLKVQAPINRWNHEDYVTSLSNTDSSATLNIEKVPSSGRESWKVKLFAETHQKLEAGKTYRVSVDVQADSSMPYEICYNNAGAESELGSKTGLNASTKKQTVTYNVTPGKEAELTLQFNLGNASKANNFTISNIKVEEAKETSAKNLIPNFRYNAVGYLKAMADEGYVTSFAQEDASATFKILHAPDERNPWNAKVVARTGFTPEAGKGYRVSVDIDSKADQKLFEIFYDGNKELDYGALYEQRLTAGKKTFSYIIYPGDSKGELSLQLRFGKTDDNSGNKYTISNIRIEEVTFTSSSTKEIKNASELVTQSGYSAELVKSADRASVRLIKTPKNGREAWKNKLFINPGVKLEQGQKYRITAVVKSIIPAPFEICLNDGDVEKGLGGIFGLMSRPQGTYISYASYVPKDIDLAVQLSLGNCVAPNTITLSDVKVEKAGKINQVSDKIYIFR